MQRYQILVKIILFNIIEPGIVAFPVFNQTHQPMKKSMLFFALIIFTLTSHAQEIAKSDLIIDLGSGFSIENNWNHHINSPLLASIQYIAFDQLIFNKGALGLGFQTGIFSYQYETYKYNVQKLAVLASYHYSFAPKFSAYVSMTTGYNIDSNKRTSIDFSGYDGFYQNASVGARYYFIPNLGVYGGVSIGETFSHFGVTLKF